MPRFHALDRINLCHAMTATPDQKEHHCDSHAATFDVEGFICDVESRCKSRGASLTPIRKEVLSLLLRHPGGLKAYDLLDRVRAERANATPPTIYRALDFLMEQGLAHKIGRMNLFIACRHASHQVPSLFVVCEKCGEVSELEDPKVMKGLTAMIARAGYRLESPEVEITVICPRCAQAA